MDHIKNSRVAPKKLIIPFYKPELSVSSVLSCCFLFCLNTQGMIEQYFHPHNHQDQPACKLGFGLIPGAEDIADLDADDGEDKGGGADEGDGRNDAYLQEGEGDADGQRIDAGGDGKQNHIARRHGAVHAFLLLIQGLPDHVESDDAQKDKCDPVVDGSDGLFKLRSQYVTEKRHARLETAEIESDDDCVFPAHPLHGESLTDRNGEGVHRKAHRDNEQLN